MNYEIWSIRPANLIGYFDSAKATDEFVRKIMELNGDAELESLPAAGPWKN